MANTQDRLRVEGIWKAFPGTQALTDVSLSVGPGEVHALVGENGAGKSTLMNIIGGVFHQDKGDIYVDGVKVSFKNPTEAVEGGIGFVHQELSLFGHLPVANNIYVDRLPMTKYGTIDKKKLYADAAEMIKLFNLGIPPETRLDELTIGSQQMIEIVRAMSLDARLVIFDEPTSSLSENEAAMLFDVINQLRDSGISVIYITHRMSEVFEISDRITVLKDGRVVDTTPTADTNMNEVVGKMVGREMSAYYPSKSSGVGEEFFRVEGYRRRPEDTPISFGLRRGEILGFYGLIGAGRSELLRGVMGIDPRFGGEIYLDGTRLLIRNYIDALRQGLTYLTEDRKETGIFHNQSVCKNLYVSDMCRERGWVLRVGDEDGKALEDVKNHDIRTSSIDEHIVNLSGGNQQKVLIARGLRVNPRVIVLDEPTRGIDVNSKAEIHKKVRGLAEQGMGVIVISSEMPEIIGVSDRVIVMHEGKVTGELEGDAMTEKSIIQYAANVPSAG